MEPAASTTANIVKPQTHPLAFLASVATLWPPTAPPVLSLPALAISSSLETSAPAARSRTSIVEAAWPAVTPIVSAAPVLLVFPARLSTTPVALLASHAAPTVIPATLVDASPAPQAISRAADLASRPQPPNRSAFPVLAPQSSAPLAARPATWTRAASLLAEWQQMGTPCT